MIQSKTDRVERWGIFEIAVTGKKDGNPFTDYEIHGVFSHRCQTVTVDGFYDGDGVYKLRFMPSFEGEYRYEISGSFPMKQCPAVLSLLRLPQGITVR